MGQAEQALTPRRPAFLVRAVLGRPALLALGAGLAAVVSLWLRPEAARDRVLALPFAVEAAA